MGINHFNYYCIENTHLSNLQRTGQSKKGVDTERDLSAPYGQWLAVTARPQNEYMSFDRTVCLAQLWSCGILSGLCMASLSRKDLIKSKQDGLCQRQCLPYFQELFVDSGTLASTNRLGSSSFWAHRERSQVLGAASDYYCTPCQQPF